MANEAQVRVSFNIRGPVSQQVQTNPGNFQADVSQDGGPDPGGFLATKAGSDVSFINLTQPGLCFIMNLGVDANGNSLFPTTGEGQYNWPYWVEVGLFDHTTNQFYPLIELLPGEQYVMRVSRFINTEIGTGSGTHAGADVVTMRVKAVGANSRVTVQCYER